MNVCTLHFFHVRYGGLTFGERRALDKVDNVDWSQREQLTAFADKLSEAIRDNYAFTFDTTTGNVTLDSLFDKIRNITGQLVTRKIVKVRLVLLIRLPHA